MNTQDIYKQLVELKAEFAVAAKFCDAFKERDDREETERLTGYVSEVQQIIDTAKEYWQTPDHVNDGMKKISLKFDINRDLISLKCSLGRAVIISKKTFEYLDYARKVNKIKLAFSG